MEPAKRISSVGVDEDVLEIKRPRTDSAPAQLPPEIWEMVFQNLSAHWLKSVRLTCQTWNQIIHGSSRLMDKFVLTLTKADFVGDHRQWVRNLLATDGRYTAAAFDFNKIGKYKPRINWFASLGTTLHTLSLKLSATFIFLGQLLNETPNLKSLHVDMLSHVRIKNLPSFQLAKLETLCIVSITSTEDLLRFFRQICPRLAELRVLQKYPKRKDQYDQELAAFAFEVRKTLKVLEAYISSAIVNELITLEDLRLTRANLWGSPEQCLRFIRGQPNLESLDMTRGAIYVPHLNEILSSSSNLTNLSVKVGDHFTQPSWDFQTSLKLETLCIVYANTVSRFCLELSVCSLPYLRKLSLIRCNLSNQVLETLQKSNLTHLTLHGCKIPRLADLRLLTSLEYVELGYNEMADLTVPELPGEDRSRVRSLKVSGVFEAVDLACVNLFGNLSRFEAGTGVDITEGFIQQLSARSPRLKELRVKGYCFPNLNALREALSRFEMLETFFVKCPFSKKSEIMECLRNVREDVAVTVKGFAYELSYGCFNTYE